MSSSSPTTPSPSQPPETETATTTETNNNGGGSQQLPSTQEEPEVFTNINEQAQTDSGNDVSDSASEGNKSRAGVVAAVVIVVLLLIGGGIVVAVVILVLCLCNRDKSLESGRRSRLFGIGELYVAKLLYELFILSTETLQNTPNRIIYGNNLSNNSQNAHT